MKRMLSCGLVTMLASCPAAWAGTWFYRSPAGADGNVVAAAGSQLLLGTRRGLYVSANGGATWTRLSSLAPGSQINQLVVDPLDANHWYIATAQVRLASIGGENGYPYANAVYQMLETHDAGQSWTDLNAVTPLHGLPVLHPTAPKAMVRYNEDPSQWWHSTDGGTNWTLSAPAAAPLDDFVGLDVPGSPYGGVFRVAQSYEFRLSSSDLTSWGAPLVAVSSNGNFKLWPRLGPTGEALWNAHINPFPGNQPSSRVGVIDFTGGVLRELPTILGVMSDLFDDPASPGGLLALVAPNGTFCDNCVRQEVWSLAPGASQWQVRGGVPTWSAFSSRLRPSAGSLWLADETLGLRRSDDGGMTWQTLAAGPREGMVAAVGVDPRDAQRLLAGRRLQSLQYSGDGGQTWADVGGQVPQDVRALARSPLDPDRVLATAAGGLYRSGDGGQTWQRVTTAVDPAAGTRGWKNLVWCANTAGDLLGTVGDTAYHSPDGGTSWTAIPGHGLGGVRQLQSAIAAPGRTYLRGVGSGNLFVSADCGQTVAPLAGADSIAVDPNNALRLVGYRISTDRFRLSNDGGATWVDSASPPNHDSAPFIGWIDACDAQRFTNLDLRTTFGTASGVLAEEAGLQDFNVIANTAESRCIGGETVTLVGHSAGVWLYRGGGDALFADDFE